MSLLAIASLENITAKPGKKSHPNSNDDLINQGPGTFLFALTFNVLR